MAVILKVSSSRVESIASASGRVAALYSHFCMYSKTSANVCNRRFIIYHTISIGQNSLHKYFFSLLLEYLWANETFMNFAFIKLEKSMWYVFASSHFIANQLRIIVTTMNAFSWSFECNLSCWLCGLKYQYQYRFIKYIIKLYEVIRAGGQRFEIIFFLVIDSWFC